MSDLSNAAAALRMISGKLSRRLRESAPPADLTWSQVSVLGHLVRNGGMTITELAKAEGVRSQSMGATVASLSGAGMVTAESVPGDGRKTRYVPTASCLALIDENRAMRDDWLLQVLERKFSAEECQTLLAAIPLLQRIADQ
ncbi:MarR family winged helix-turn-helix transcriptional regulator [Pantoea sp. A4]|uniref:MarR family winged helix-turn-helix transcriptional regulator n=1 Tax=Pantoea sp. A4 TaxID=1225184 RepID=UPI000377283E|nr:MarR family transcriptional regulator [Pantoea sp. A4]